MDKQIIYEYIEGECIIQKDFELCNDFDIEETIENIRQKLKIQGCELINLQIFPLFW